MLLSILGGGLLGGGGPTIQKGAPKTQLITHTRSFLTTITSLETIEIPVNFRGSTIFQTVTDQKTDLVTVTDYSVQTVLNYAAQSKSQPFLPLAPTLHRAARVVPASPPPLNLLPILQTSPPQLQTSLLTQTETVTSTVTSLATSQILLTLGGRAITTEIVEPVTQVIDQLIKTTQLMTLSSGGHLHHSLNTVRPGGRVPKSLSDPKPEATAVASGHPWSEESLNKNLKANYKTPKFLYGHSTH